jgi:hypothetical protein
MQATNDSLITPRRTDHRLLTIMRRIARALALVLFAFWGLFFIEHTSEWFLRPAPQMPPPKVWLAHGLHFLILAGLLIGFRWELAGGLLVIVASVLFFADKAPLFILPTIVPAILYLYCWHNDRNRISIP